MRSRMANYVEKRMFKPLIFFYIYLTTLGLNENSFSDPMKILIVDDNFEMRRMTRNYLQDLADEFLECEDGAEALAAYEQFLPDWVLMDWEMKQMDGIAATKEILRFFPTARILMFTQYDDVELRTAASEVGVSGYVLKDDLMKLQSFLKNHIFC